MPLPNPYTPSGRPRVFVGRQSERRAIRDRLARVIAFGEMMGPLVLVTGPRGLGKTSLLRDVQTQAAESGFVVAWASGVRQQPFLPDVTERTTRAIVRAGLDRDMSSLSAVKELGLEVGIGVAKVSAKFAGAPTQSASAALVGPVEDFFREASNHVRRMGGAGILVVIDELHAPLSPARARDSPSDDRAALDAAILLNAVQNMEGEREEFPLGVIGAGLPETKALLTTAATFAERTHEFVLAPLNKDESISVLREPAELCGVHWEEDAVELAVSHALGYPQTLQLIGSAAWDVGSPERRDSLGVEHVEKALRLSQTDQDSLFRARWHVASDAERAFLWAMAECTDLETDRAAVATTMGVHTDALGMTRRSLISKGLIESPRRGVLRFTLPGFAAFVRRTSV